MTTPTSTPPNFVVCVRNVRKSNGGFGSEPGATRYLLIPPGETPDPEEHVLARAEWLAKLRRRAARPKPENPDPKSRYSSYTRGDVLIFVHGYNNSQQKVLERHELLQENLRKFGFAGAVASFDWPSADSALNYLEDRSDARSTADQLTDDGIRLLAFAQRAQDEQECDIDVHLLAHSTGAYVVREAFYYASQSRPLARVNWNVSQVAFIGADIARRSLSARDRKSEPLFEHSTRITNYQNPFDRVLKLSNVKRLGAQPRIGRVGVPDGAPDSVVNVNSGAHWKDLRKPKKRTGNWSHSWHFHDLTFAEDLAATLAGDDDRHVIRTRRRTSDGLVLRRPGP